MKQTFLLSLIICSLLSCKKEQTLSPAIEAATLQTVNYFYVDEMIPDPCANGSVHVTGTLKYTQTEQSTGNNIDYSFTLDYGNLQGEGYTGLQYKATGQATGRARATLNPDGTYLLVGGHYNRHLSFIAPGNIIYTRIVSEFNIDRNTNLFLNANTVFFDGCK